jgi:hypothetical protein
LINLVEAVKRELAPVKDELEELTALVEDGQDLVEEEEIKRGQLLRDKDEIEFVRTTLRWKIRPLTPIVSFRRRLKMRELEYVRHPRQTCYYNRSSPNFESSQMPPMRHGDPQCQSYSRAHPHLRQ